jgi:hypothetical protein
MLHVWTEATKVNLHHVLKHYKNNNICLRYVKTTKERYWYSYMSYWEETYFRVLDKRIRVPAKRTGACCQKKGQVHVSLVTKC